MGSPELPWGRGTQGGVWKEAGISATAPTWIISAQWPLPGWPPRNSSRHGKVCLPTPEAAADMGF